jgi:hypothetical protein
VETKFKGKGRMECDTTMAERYIYFKEQFRNSKETIHRHVMKENSILINFERIAGQQYRPSESTSPPRP